MQTRELFVWEMYKSLMPTFVPDSRTHERSMIARECLLVAQAYVEEWEDFFSIKLESCKEPHVGPFGNSDSFI